MSRFTALSLAVALVALLLSPVAFAAEPPSQDTFLASLEAPPAVQAPTLSPTLGNQPEPILAAIPDCPVGCCSYQCKKCTTTSVKLCAYNSCTGQSGCDPCHSGTVCSY